MGPTHDKPPRKRRRPLIVVVVLFLGSGVSWWTRPSGDVRLVGKWIVSDPASPAFGSGGMSLYPSGIARSTSIGVPGSRSFTWHVEGDTS